MISSHSTKDNKSSDWEMIPEKEEQQGNEDEENFCRELQVTRNVSGSNSS